MDLEPLQTSLLTGRVAIATAALTHGLCATFIVGSALIGAATATVAHLGRQERFRRLAHLIAFSLVISTATISFLGVVLVFCLNIFWPRFWHTIFRIMFWPFLLEAGLFLGEAVFAYSWYYLWAWSGASIVRRRWHLTFAWLAAICAVAAMFMIDIVASYMLTPYPAGEAWGNILNPTMLHLDLHRWFGNLTWAGFALASICAIGSWLARSEEDRRFYAWGGGFCLLIGFGALVVMPIIGYQYLLHVRYGQPQAFHTLMLGERSWLFDFVGLFYGVLVVAGSISIWRIVKTSAPPGSSARTFVPASLVLLALAAVLLALPYHLRHVPGMDLLTDRSIIPLGKMQPYKYMALALLVVLGFGNWLYGVRWFRWRPAVAGTAASPSVLLLLGVVSMLIMLNMGWVRETARAANGYLIFGEFRLTDELPTYGGAEHERATASSAP
ncbi:cytochrome ubiquinol oxidase subunit I [Candidatus Nitrospira bockiana]